MRRRSFVVAVAGGVLVTAGASLVVIPQQQRRAATLAVAAPTVQVDTVAIMTAIGKAEARARSADSALGATRAQAAQAQARTRAVVDTLSPELVARRDSLSGVAAELQELMTRVETAPLAASYRALAAAPALSGNDRVRALIDSLSEVERERDSFGAGGGADPIYVALTQRATEIGRAMQLLAAERRDVLRRNIALVAAPVRRAAEDLALRTDTLPWIAERDSARSAVTLANQELTSARSRVSAARKVERDRAASAMSLGQPGALLGALLVFGLVVGFAVAMQREVANPLIADAAEVEAACGVKVIATVSSMRRAPTRMRRDADQEMPALVNPLAEPHQIAYLHVARSGASHLILTVTGDESSIAAVVATNLAAIAADEARTTILIDGDSAGSPVARLLGLHESPGVTDVAGRDGGWVDATRRMPLGRDRVIDVILGGSRGKPVTPAALCDSLDQNVNRLTRHYDAIIVVATMDQAMAGVPARLPVNDTILCARVCHTSIRELTEQVQRVHAAGGNPVGAILWDAPPPLLADTPKRDAKAARPTHTESAVTSPSQ